MNVLAVSGLRKSYGDFCAVDSLDFTVSAGDIYGFLGPNGAGKSTTLRMLAGLIHPSSGSITFFGKDFLNNRLDTMRRVGYIVEKPDFYKYLSAKSNLQLLLKMNGSCPSALSIEKVIEMVGLKGRENDPVKTYSHGMKQRLGLAQALIHNPEVVILDEPTTGLDPQGIIDLRNLVLMLKQEGKTVIMSSHILSEVELIATRMVIISNGKAIVEGVVSELLNADDLIVEFGFSDLQSAKQLIANSSYHPIEEDVFLNKLIFKLNRKETTELNNWFCANQVGVESITSRRRLEDYFIKLTQ